MHRFVVPSAQVFELQQPKTFFTFANDESGPAVLKAMEHFDGLDLRTLKSEEELKTLDLSRSVAVFRGTPRNEFSPIRMTAINGAAPAWAKGATWGVMVGKKCTNYARCAHMTYALFTKRFRLQIDEGQFPWGPPKKKQEGPRDIVHLDEVEMQRLQSALNSGPDLAAAIANKAFASDLPKDSKISWIRIPPSPAQFDASSMYAITVAMQEFEKASNAMLREDPTLKDVILAGVKIPDLRLREIYIDPGVEHFTVRRPDVHWGEGGDFVSENDEMPGGMPELCHIDAVYGLNQDRWRIFFSGLCEAGPLVFLVSDKWSECYIPETKWLVEWLDRQGYPVHLLTANNLQEVSIREDGVYLRSIRIGTIWRQFPIFESEGILAEVVIAARREKVRLVPEFAHFGNKSWFDLFWQNQERFKDLLDTESFATLGRILPESYLVRSASSFPLRFKWGVIPSMNDLAHAADEIRDQLVLKIAGANSMASRSHGVLMGNGIPARQWKLWVEDRIRDQAPFLVQQRFKTAIARLPVWNTKQARPELFRCRVLLRPWVYRNTIVSVHGCAVPEQYFKVHGMVDMAVVPTLLT